MDYHVLLVGFASFSFWQNCVFPIFLLSLVLLKQALRLFGMGSGYPPFHYGVQYFFHSKK
jgi:maltodextrin utilization protein YvdJ